MSDFQSISAPSADGAKEAAGFTEPADAQRLERAAAALRQHGFTVEILDDAAAARARVNDLITGVVHGPAEILSFALPLVSPRTLMVAPMLLGLPFTAITLFAMREARRLRGDAAAGLMGYATASYGLGQIAGPLVAAPIAEHTGSFSTALWIAAMALAAGAAGLAYVARRGTASP